MIRDVWAADVGYGRICTISMEVFLSMGTDALRQTAKWKKLFIGMEIGFSMEFERFLYFSKEKNWIWLKERDFDLIRVGNLFFDGIGLELWAYSNRWDINAQR